MSAQYLICFFVARLSEVTPRITLQCDEADAFVWLPLIDLPQSGDALTDSPTTVEVHPEGSRIPLRDLLRRYDSAANGSKEGCAEAHLFALQEYLRSAKKNQSEK